MAPRPLIALVMSFAILALPVVGAHAQSTSSETERAEALFYEGQFEDALVIIDKVIARSGMSTSDLRDAHALKARCEAELGNRANAINSFCQVIVIDPEWRPDPDFYTSAEVELFDQAHDRCFQETEPATPGKAWYLKPVTWIAGGATAALAVVLLSGGSDSGGDGGGNGNPAPELPDFPGPPQ